MKPPLQPCLVCKSSDVAYQHEGISGEHRIECQSCGVLFCFPVDLGGQEVRDMWNTAERMLPKADDTKIISTCPRCGAEQEDFDGVGVVHCACGYCNHPSYYGGTCEICGQPEAEVRL